MRNKLAFGLLMLAATNSFGQGYYNPQDPQIEPKVSQAMCIVQKSYHETSAGFDALGFGALIPAIGFHYVKLKADGFKPYWVPELKEILRQRYEIFNFDEVLLNSAKRTPYSNISQSTIDQIAQEQRIAATAYQQKLLSLMYRDASMGQAKFYEDLLDLGRVMNIDALRLNDFFSQLELSFPELTKNYQIILKQMPKIKTDFEKAYGTSNMYELELLSTKASKMQLTDNEMWKLINLEKKAQIAIEKVRGLNTVTFEIAEGLDKTLATIVDKSELLKFVEAIVPEDQIIELESSIQKLKVSEKSAVQLYDTKIKPQDAMSDEATIAETNTAKWLKKASMTRASTLMMLALAVYFEFHDQSEASRITNTKLDHMDAVQLRRFFYTPEHHVELEALLNHYDHGFEGCNFYPIPVAAKK